jgi:hypothetical protein
MDAMVMEIVMDVSRDALANHVAATPMKQMGIGQVQLAIDVLIGIPPHLPDVKLHHVSFSYQIKGLLKISTKIQNSKFRLN